MTVSRWPTTVLIGILALLGISASASFYLRDAANPDFAQFPIITALHVLLGGVYLLLAPFQFVPHIRQRWLTYHRWSGRLLVAIGAIVGVTAIFMAVIIPFSGWPERIIVGPFAILYSVAILNGFRHARAGRIAQHRDWMMRAFSIGLAIGTTRLILIPWIIVIVRTSGMPTDAQLATSTVTSFAVALFVHAIAAEVWIRRGEKKIAYDESALQQQVK